MGFSGEKVAVGLKSVFRPGKMQGVRCVSGLLGSVRFRFEKKMDKKNMLMCYGSKVLIHCKVS